MSSVLLQYTAMFNVKTVSCVNSENSNCNYKRFLAFFNFDRVVS